MKWMHMPEIPKVVWPKQMSGKILFGLVEILDFLQYN